MFEVVDFGSKIYHLPMTKNRLGAYKMLKRNKVPCWMLDFGSLDSLWFKPYRNQERFYCKKYGLKGETK